MKQIFSREDTKVMKGVAIILMLAHHLWAFPDRYPVGFAFYSWLSVEGQPLEVFLGSFGKICVAMFMFLGGYGMYWKTRKRGGIFLDIIHLYKGYWKVFLIFIPVGFLLFSGQSVDYAQNTALCTRFTEFHVKEFIGNFIGWSSSYNSEWWFFRTYLCAIFLGYVFLQLIQDHKNFWMDVSIVIVLSIFIQTVFPSLGAMEAFQMLNNNLFFSNLCTINSFACSFFMGIVFAKYNELEKIMLFFQKYGKIERAFFAVMGIGLICYTRGAIFGEQVDIFYVPCLIVVILELVQLSKGVRQGLVLLGKNSTNMWLIHSFYCYYFYEIEKVVYSTHYALMDLAILLFLSFVSSIAVDFFWKNLQQLFLIIRNKLNIAIK